MPVPRALRAGRGGAEQRSGVAAWIGFAGRRSGGRHRMRVYTATSSRRHKPRSCRVASGGRHGLRVYGATSGRRHRTRNCGVARRVEFTALGPRAADAGGTGAVVHQIGSALKILRRRGCRKMRDDGLYPVDVAVPVAAHLDLNLPVAVGAIAPHLRRRLFRRFLRSDPVH